MLARSIAWMILVMLAACGAQSRSAHALVGIRQLTARTSGQHDISPDSQWIVYITDQRLVAIRPDGSDRHEIARKVNGFAIAPDSRSVAYAGEAGVFVTPLAGGASRRLGVPHGHRVDALTISPDSRWALYDSGSGVAIVSLETPSRSRPLLGPHKLGVVYKVTPDSARVVYRGTEHVLSVGLDGADPKDLTPGAERTDLYDLAKDGAVVGRKHFLGFAAFDGSGERSLALDYPMSVHVVDEGRSIVVHDREHNLMHFDLATGASRRINRPLVDDEQVYPFLASEGRLLAYAIFGQLPGDVRTFELRLVDLAEPDGDHVIGTIKDASEATMKLTPDRRRTIIRVQRRDRMSFLAIDLETSKVSNLMAERPGWGNFQISPDSRYVLFDVTTTRATGQRELYVLAL